jgi:hypothetical protein
MTRAYRPYHPGKRYLDSDLEGPAGKPAEAVRPTVDEIDGRVQALLKQLVGPGTRGQ